VNVDDLRDLQDKVHAILVRLKDDALRCAEPDPEPQEVCVFDESSYDDPLAYRIQLPIPKTPVANKPCPCEWKHSADTGDQAVDDVIDYYVREPSSRACRNNPVGPRCLTNMAIDSWKAKMIQALQERAGSKTD